mmetsp:Transcript_3952/g.10908  ORF Transcript_3952/g.10908 Transcript_3952/m.10908 type:complete len:259 (-) Transcript_3952:720-1496(-)
MAATLVGPRWGRAGAGIPGSMAEGVLARCSGEGSGKRPTVVPPREDPPSGRPGCLPGTDLVRRRLHAHIEVVSAAAGVEGYHVGVDPAALQRGALVRDLCARRPGKLGLTWRPQSVGLQLQALPVGSPHCVGTLLHGLHDRQAVLRQHNPVADCDLTAVARHGRAARDHGGLKVARARGRRLGAVAALHGLAELGGLVAAWRLGPLAHLREILAPGGRAFPRLLLVTFNGPVTDTRADAVEVGVVAHVQVVGAVALVE